MLKTSMVIITVENIDEVEQKSFETTLYYKITYIIYIFEFRQQIFRIFCPLPFINPTSFITFMGVISTDPGVLPSAEDIIGGHSWSFSQNLQYLLESTKNVRKMEIR